MATYSLWHRTSNLLACGILLRCLVFLSGLNQWFATRLAFVTPITAWDSVLEGLSLLDNGISPYKGDTVHESPLVLLLFKLLKDKHDLIIPAFFIMCDVLIGYILYKISEIHCKIQLEDQSKNLENYAKNTEVIHLSSDNLKDVPFYVMASYLLNPFAIGSCSSQSTGIFTSLAIVLALYFALTGSVQISTFFLAFATYKSLYPIMLLVPVILIISKAQKKDGLISCVFHVTFSTLYWLSGLFALSYFVTGSWDYINSTHGYILRFPDLTPNMGLFWYFFLEMFDHFRDFFAIVFQINAFFYIIPLTSILRNEPVFLFYSLVSAIALFKSYPAFGDFSIPFSMLIMRSYLLSYMKNNLIVSLMLVISSLLNMVFGYLWLYAASANANFIYAATLAYCAAQVFLLTDVVFSHRRREFDLYNGITRKTVDNHKMTVVLK